MNETLIKTIVFDLGGVYFTVGTVLTIDKIIQIYELNDRQQHILQESFSNKPNSLGHSIRLGLVSIEEFEQVLVDKLELEEINPHQIHKIWFNSYLPNYDIQEVLRTLKLQGYRLIVFSGNVRERIQFLEIKNGFSKYFDDFVYSFDYQLNKDDDEFYEILIEKLLCDPQEALFIEDQQKNLKKARAFGFNTIQYYYTEQLIQELKSYNIEISIANK